MQHIAEYDRSSSACSQRTQSDEGFEHDDRIKVSEFSRDSDDDETALQRQAIPGKSTVRRRVTPNRETDMHRASEEEEGHGDDLSSQAGDDGENTESTMDSRGMSMMSKLSRLASEFQKTVNAMRSKGNGKGQSDARAEMLSPLQIKTEASIS